MRKSKQPKVQYARAKKHPVNSQSKRHGQSTILSRLLRRGRFCLFVLMAIAGLVAAYYAWLTLKDPDFLPIRTVKIEASYQHIEPNDLQKRILPLTQSNLLLFDHYAVRQLVMQNPWVKQVEVSRFWPDTIVIHIQEQRATARWGDKGLLNQEAQIFYPPPASFPDHLPWLQGPDSQAKQMLSQYRHVERLLKSLNLHVVRMQLTSRRSLSYVFNNGIELVLGREDLQARLARFIRVYPRLSEQDIEKIAKIDLRYNNGLALSWRQGADQAIAAQK